MVPDNEYPLTHAEYFDCFMEIAEQNGWNRKEHEAALRSGNEDAITITHPGNYVGEEEWEEHERNHR